MVVCSAHFVAFQIDFLVKFLQNEMATFFFAWIPPLSLWLSLHRKNVIEWESRIEL